MRTIPQLLEILRDDGLRKATSFKQVDANDHITVSEDEFASLPHRRQEFPEMNDPSSVVPRAEFMERIPDMFFLQHACKHYLVSMEGYNYCRYIMRVDFCSH